MRNRIIKTTEVVQKPGFGLAFVGDDVIINIDGVRHTLTISYLERKLAKHKKSSTQVLNHSNEAVITPHLGAKQT